MTNFLLIYDRAARHLLTLSEFSDADEAALAYDTAELEQLGNDDVEVVLVGADSLETIKRTHGQYFEADAPGAADRSWTATSALTRLTLGPLTPG